MTQAYPLHWPEGWARNDRPSDDRFKVTLAQALSNVEDSIRKFSTDSNRKVDGIVISSNYSLTDRKPKDAGVAVYFSWDGLSTCIAVDRYRRIEANLQAIHHCIEAERTKLRHGGINVVRAAFRGYAALPPPGADWRATLGLGPDATLDDAEAAYRRRMKHAHPDAGGCADQAAALNAAIRAAREDLSHA